MPLEANQKPRRAFPATRENVPAFGEFLDEDPTHVPARLHKAIGPHLADSLVEKLSDGKASSSRLLHVGRE
jgi:hypothetical protein